MRYSFRVFRAPKAARKAITRYTKLRRLVYINKSKKGTLLCVRGVK